MILASSQISDESISLKYWRLQVSLILRCCPGRSQRNFEILDCFVLSTLDWLYWHACTSCTCRVIFYTLLLLPISIWYLMQDTNSEGLSWGGARGGEMACLGSASCYYGKWPDNQTLTFQNRCNWQCESLYTSRVIEKPLQNGSIVCSPWLLTGWVNQKGRASQECLILAHIIGGIKQEHFLFCGFFLSWYTPHRNLRCYWECTQPESTIIIPVSRWWCTCILMKLSERHYQGGSTDAYGHFALCLYEWVLLPGNRFMSKFWIQ